MGEHREFLLREFLREFLPAKYGVGTGFILFEDPDAAAEAGTDSRLQPSKQLDIIIWNQLDYAPHFRAGEFVVVPPGAVVAVLLVKSTLGSTQLRKDLGRLMDVTMQYDELRLVDGYFDVRTPDLMLFGWAPEVNDRGVPTLSPMKIAGIIRDLVRERLVVANDPLTYFWPPVAAFLYRYWTVVLSDETCHVGGTDVRELCYRSLEMGRGAAGDTKDYSLAELLRIFSASLCREDHQVWYKVRRTGADHDPRVRRAVLGTGADLVGLDRVAFHSHELDFGDSDDLEENE